MSSSSSSSSISLHTQGKSNPCNLLFLFFHLLSLITPSSSFPDFSYGSGSGYGIGGGGGGGGGGGFGFFTPYVNFYNPWASFLNFSSCHFGDSQQGLWQLKQYFAGFGYLPSNPSFSDAFDDPFRQAVLAYQRFFHLNATGELDPATLEVMVQPRCGVADLVPGGAAPGRNLYTFFPGNPSWPADKKNLTYAFTSTSASSLGLTVLRKVFARAFGRWAEVTTLTFTEVAAGEQADITIGFYSGNHGDGEPFDGQLGTLAHAFSPTDGRFHLDAAELWVASAEDAPPSGLLQSPVAVDLESVAVHEIGHLLGLGHSNVEGAIMYPTIKTRTRRVQLGRDDIQGIQSLYGNNTHYNGTSNYGSEGPGIVARDNGVASVPAPAASTVALATAIVAVLLTSRRF